MYLLGGIVHKLLWVSKNLVTVGSDSLQKQTNKQKSYLTTIVLCLYIVLYLHDLIVIFICFESECEQGTGKSSTVEPRYKKVGYKKTLL